MRLKGLPPASTFKFLAGPWGLLILSVVLVAVAYDVYRSSGRAPRTPSLTVADEVQQVILGAADAPYVDPAGRFSIVPPAGWQVSPTSDDNFYDVTFFSPGRASLNILASPVDYDDMHELYEQIRRRERDYSIFTKIETVRFQDRPTILRTAQLPGKKLIARDFVENRVAYHILCEIPDDFFKDYDFALGEVLKSFKVTAPAPDAAAAP